MSFSPQANDLTTLSALKAWLGIPNGEVLAVEVTAGGSGATGLTTVTFGGPGTGATAVPVIVGGVVTAIVVTAPGQGNLPTTTVTISGGGVVGATAVIPAAGINPIQNTADAFLSRLISAASNFILRYIGRDVILAQSFTETRDGHGGTRIFTRQFPVNSVASVSLDGVLVPASVGTPPAAGYRFTDRSIDLLGYAFTRGNSNVVLTYNAGYTAGASFELLVLEQACFDLCAQKWARRGHVDQSSVSVGNQSTVFSQRDMPQEVKTQLQSFRSMAVLT